MSAKSRILLLILILAVGFLLGIWGFQFGLPYQFHQDEPIVVNHALAYGTGDFNPHFFIIPPLPSYLLFFVYGLYYLVLSIFGVVKSTEQFAILFFSDPTMFYELGRIALGIIPSLGSVYLTYVLARKFFSSAAALYAASVMAVGFLNVVNSKYIYTDNLLVMLVLAACIALISAMQKPAMRRFIFTGIFFGLAVAVKYNAALLIAPFLVTFFLAARKEVNFKTILLPAILFVAAAVALFIISNPFCVLDWRFFLENVTGRIRHGYIGWSHHLTYSLFEGMGMAVTVSGIAGLLCLLKKNLTQGLFIVAFPCIFYLHLVFMSQEFSRYVLPLIPFIAIGAGFLLFEICYQRHHSKVVRFSIVGIACALLIPSLVKSIKADILFSRKDTRIEAQEWIEKNIPAHAKIALADTFFKPPLLQEIKQIADKNKILDKQPELAGLKNVKLNLQVKAAKLQSGTRYETYYIVHGNEFSGQFLNFWPVVNGSLEQMRQQGIEYVVFNNMRFSEDIISLRGEVVSQSVAIAEFSPYLKGGFRLPYDVFELTAMPISSNELFSRKKTGPFLIIYRLK